jgi:hypothetical protein
MMVTNRLMAFRRLNKDWRNLAKAGASLPEAEFAPRAQSSANDKILLAFLGVGTRGSDIQNEIARPRAPSYLQVRYHFLVE